MIEVTVYLTNKHDSIKEVIDITKEELLQFACIKAKGEYEEGYWTQSSANEVTVRIEN